jgi:hypothetical protein
MSDSHADAPLPELCVIVSRMPEPPDKPLLKDSKRLLGIGAFAISLVSFILSLLTGSVGIYYLWYNNRETAVDTVFKSMDQYYDAQEKLLLLNEVDNLRQMNLLRNRARASAARSVYLAKSVQSSVPDGIWSALAEINDSELNLQAAESAWQTARDTTKDIEIFLYATRNLAANQMHQHKIKEADRYYQLALDVALNDQAGGTALTNVLLPDARFAQAAVTHAYWLDESADKDCTFLVPHYDATLKFIADASPNGRADSLKIQRQIVGTRELLSRFRKPRQACAPALDTALESANYCLLIADIVGSARADFSVYKGPSNRTKTEFRSRVMLPEATLCGINSNSSFYCVWTERDEAAVNVHTERLIGALTSCLGASTRIESRGELAADTLPTIDLNFADRGNVRIKRNYSKPTESSKIGHWDLAFEIDAQR